MTARWIRRARDERGMSLVFVAVGFMAFLAATTLAIDVGMFMTARSQAQNSADAGALAGAVALVFDDYTDRTPTGPAVQSAIEAATANRVMSEAVSVTPADVTFPPDERGLPNRVRVDVSGPRAGNLAAMMGDSSAFRPRTLSARRTAEAFARERHQPA